jgi:hypothetical protein
METVEVNQITSTDKEITRGSKINTSLSRMYR